MQLLNLHSEGSAEIVLRLCEIASVTDGMAANIDVISYRPAVNASLGNAAAGGGGRGGEGGVLMSSLAIMLAHVTRVCVCSCWLHSGSIIQLMTKILHNRRIVLGWQ